MISDVPSQIVVMRTSRLIFLDHVPFRAAAATAPEWPHRRPCCCRPRSTSTWRWRLRCSRSCLVDAPAVSSDGGATGFERDRMRYDELVRVALFSRERAAALTRPLIADRAVKAAQPALRPKVATMTRVKPEDELRLNETFGFDVPDDPIDVDVNVVERERCRCWIGCRLSSGFALREVGHAAFEDEPRWTAGRIGEDRDVSAPAVADPLFVARDLVADDLAVFSSTGTATVLI